MGANRTQKCVAFVGTKLSAIISTPSLVSPAKPFSDGMRCEQKSLFAPSAITAKWMQSQGGFVSAAG